MVASNYVHPVKLFHSTSGILSISHHNKPLFWHYEIMLQKQKTCPKEDIVIIKILKHHKNQEGTVVTAS